MKLLNHSNGIQKKINWAQNLMKNKTEFEKKSNKCHRALKIWFFVKKIAVNLYKFHDFNHLDILFD